MSKRVLIIFPSWEDRSTLGFERIVGQNNFNEVIMFKYSTSLYETETDLAITKIKSISEGKGLQIKSIEIDNDNAITTWKNIEGFAHGLTSTDLIEMDISTMPRHLIWTLLFFIKGKNKSIKYHYSKPSSYSNDWLSREPDTPRLLLKHSGIIKFGVPTALVILTGFDAERTLQLINFYEPKLTLLGIQKGSQFNNESRNNEEKHLLECKGLTECISFEIDAYSGDNGYSTLYSEINKLEDYNIIASSLGPKLTSLSLYKYYLANSNIALSYVPCKEYNLNYCSGLGETISKDFLFM